MNSERKIEKTSTELVVGGEVVLAGHLDRLVRLVSQLFDLVRHLVDEVREQIVNSLDKVTLENGADES